MNREFAYKFTEFSLTELKPNLTLKELDTLRFDNIVKTGKLLELVFNEKECFSNIGDKKISFSLIMTNDELKKLKSELSNKKYLCKADILYTENLNEYSIYNLEIFKIFNPIEKWQNKMKNRNITERIEEILKILGINPDFLMEREKIIFIMRLIPLIQKKYLLLDFSMRGLGKSTTYSTLEYPFTSLMTTRANIFYNGQNKELGEFFSTPYCFILDEFQKIEDNEIFKIIQTYMDNDRDKGTIQLNNLDIRTLDKSIVLLGNPRQNIAFQKIFTDKINIFEGTALYKKNQEDGDAFLSRVDAMLNSWGCREFSQEMVLNIENKYMKFLLKEAITELREYKVNIDEIISFLNICENQISKRAKNSIGKTFEGLVKLLYPEIFLNVNIYKDSIDDFKFLYDISQEMRLTIESMLKILKPNENIEHPPVLFSDRFIRTLQNKMNLSNFAFTPHRVIICDGKNIIKIPLDTIGVKQNEEERGILSNFSVFSNKWGFDNFNKRLFHDFDITVNTFIQISNKLLKNLYTKISFGYLGYNELFTLKNENGDIIFKYKNNMPIIFDSNYRPVSYIYNNYQYYFLLEQYNDINSLSTICFTKNTEKSIEQTIERACILFKNPKWDNEITYNYLIGKNELIYRDSYFYIRNYTFYDLKLN